MVDPKKITLPNFFGSLYNIHPCGMIFYSSEIVGPSDGNARSKEPLFKHFAKITLNI